MKLFYHWFLFIVIVCKYLVFQTTCLHAQSAVETNPFANHTITSKPDYCCVRQRETGNVVLSVPADLTGRCEYLQNMFDLSTHSISIETEICSSSINQESFPEIFSDLEPYGTCCVYHREVLIYSEFEQTKDSDCIKNIRESVWPGAISIEWVYGYFDCPRQRQENSINLLLGVGCETFLQDSDINVNGQQCYIDEAQESPLGCFLTLRCQN